MDTDPDSLLSILFLLVLPSGEIFLGIATVILLLLASALVSGSEVAYFSLTENDLEKLDSDNNRSSDRILFLKDHPRTLLATILISNNFINIAIVIISEFVLRQLLPDMLFEQWASGLREMVADSSLFPTLYEPYFSIAGTARTFSFLITVVGVTFLLVLFGEVAPKVYASLNNIYLARIMSGPLKFLMRAFSPISRILVSWTNKIENRLESSTQTGSLTSREDIDEAIELTVSNTQDADQEIDILKSIVKFGEVSVTQIMRSRLDIIAVDFRFDYVALLDVIKDSGFSRIPVYDEDIDNITGILYVKDLLGHLHEDNNFEWQELIRTNVLFVPEAKKIDDLLREFQLQRLHMAVVVDEYGGTSGIVTLEDIMEEIIGDIKDEFDDKPEVIYKQISDNEYAFEGKTLLNDVCRVLGISTSTFDEVKGEANSLAGLILEVLGEQPEEGSSLAYDRFVFKTSSVNERRIEEIIVIVTPEAEEATEDNK
ncbi:MAG: gliding motility-associated protein GldE [Cyanothece sp. SIO1E1]|nr:gliding motility-associated protein GldE [Cyanothece sp. SIO1E1]